MYGCCWVFVVCSSVRFELKFFKLGMERLAGLKTIIEVS